MVILNKIFPAILTSAFLFSCHPLFITDKRHLQTPHNNYDKELLFGTEVGERWKQMKVKEYAGRQTAVVGMQTAPSTNLWQGEDTNNSSGCLVTAPS